MQVYCLITNRCNLKCTMCIRGKGGDQDMDYHLFKFMLKKFDTRKFDIVISGGEATLHPHFTEFIIYASKYSRSVSIATNGTTHNYLDELRGILNLQIQVSLDGKKSVHDAIRGKGTFDKVMSTIEQLEKKNMSYCISSVINKINLNTIKELIPILFEFPSMKYWKLSYEMPFGCANKVNMLSSKEWNLFVDDLLKIAPFRLNIKKIFDFSLYDNAFQENKVNYSRCLKNCGNCIKKVYVNPNFDVYPCTCLMDFCLGNLINEELQDILNNEVTKQFTNYIIDPNLPCKNCRYFKLCYGGCIGMSYNIFGELGKGDIRCPKIQNYYKVCIS